MRSARIKLYRQALKVWGYHAQIAMLHEEIGELLSAIGKLVRRRIDVLELVDELADVRIMLEQVEEMFDIPPGLVEQAIDRKTSRLRGRLPLIAPDPPKWKQRIALDFDGVVHSYVSGWKGSLVVADPPVAGAFDFIRRAHLCGVEIMIHTARLAFDETEHFHENTPVEERIDVLIEWFQRHGLEEVVLDETVRFHTGPGKPHAEIYVDDRAFVFRGAFPDLEALPDFRPWNKVGAS